LNISDEKLLHLLLHYTSFRILKFSIIARRKKFVRIKNQHKCMQKKLFLSISEKLSTTSAENFFFSFVTRESECVGWKWWKFRWLNCEKSFYFISGKFQGKIIIYVVSMYIEWINTVHYKNFMNEILWHEVCWMINIFMY